MTTSLSFNHPKKGHQIINVHDLALQIAESSYQVFTKEVEKDLDVYHFARHISFVYNIDVKQSVSIAKQTIKLMRLMKKKTPIFKQVVTITHEELKY